MTQIEYRAIMLMAKEDTSDMETFFIWLQKYPNFADGHLAPIEIELSFLCYNIAFAGRHWDKIK